MASGNQKHNRGKETKGRIQETWKKNNNHSKLTYSVFTSLLIEIFFTTATNKSRWIQKPKPRPALVPSVIDRCQAWLSYLSTCSLWLQSLRRKIVGLTRISSCLPTASSVCWLRSQSQRSSWMALSLRSCLWHPYHTLSLPKAASLKKVSLNHSK